MFGRPFLLRCGVKPSLRVQWVHIARTIAEVRDYQSRMVQRGGKTMGFVPTMGALHPGHISLVTQAKKENDIVASSIFVNPTQFSVGEDLDKYPRTFDADLAMLTAAGVDMVFAPITTEIYPPEERLCHVEPSAFGSIYEGQARPEFFRGVATIVSKLFNIVQPSTAYFGQKDISQCILISRMVHDLNIPVKIRVCETIRENDGLAMSSRNTYLTSDERPKARVLYQALSAGKELCEKELKMVGAGNRDEKDVGVQIPREHVILAIHNILKSQPAVTKVEYISVASYETMRELDHVTMSSGAVLSSAVRLGNVRLIDNLLVGMASKSILGH